VKPTPIKVLLATVVTAAVTWFLRGVYDEINMDEGVFYVVNAASSQRKIELVFPSGERRSAVFEAGQAMDMQVANTGEGAVSVLTDGETIGPTGYVASHNNLSVVVVQSDRALFAQCHRR